MHQDLSVLGRKRPPVPPAVRLREVWQHIECGLLCLQKVDHVTDYCVPDLELNRVNFGRQMEKMSKSLYNKPEDLKVLFQPLKLLTRLLLHVFSFKGLWRPIPSGYSLAFSCLIPIFDQHAINISLFTRRVHFFIFMRQGAKSWHVFSVFAWQRHPIN